MKSKYLTDAEVSDGWRVVAGVQWNTQGNRIKPGDLVMQGGPDHAYIPPGACMVTRVHGAPGSGFYVHLLVPETGKIDRFYVPPSRTILLLPR